MLPRLLVVAAALGLVPHDEPLQVAVDRVMEVCGSVEAVIRGLPGRCDATLTVAAGDARWGVILPADVRQPLLDPLEGASVCVSGSLWPVTDGEAKDFGTSLVLRVVSAGAIRRTGAAPAGRAFPPSGVSEACDPEVTPPRRIDGPAPRYPSEAVRARIEGVVHLEAVVDTTGAVSDVRIAKSLDPLLDEAAMAALREWKFTPGTREGQPVPVLVSVQMSFAMRAERMSERPREPLTK